MDKIVPEKKDDKKPRYVAKGQMLKHIRNQKRMYLWKEQRKYTRARYYQASLARAWAELEKETIPPLRPTVWIKKNKVNLNIKN